MSKKPNQPQKPNNPYAAAAGAYDQHAQAHTPDPRELEARVLLKAARGLKDLQANWDKQTPATLEEALIYNRQIWLMFVDTAMEDKSPDRPKELRNNIANLGLFVFNQTLDILAQPKKEKLNILIEINQEIAAGLMTRPKAEQPA
jgi:flagellar protein FlaF